MNYQYNILQYYNYTDDVILYTVYDTSINTTAECEKFHQNLNTLGFRLKMITKVVLSKSKL